MNHNYTRAIKVEATDVSESIETNAMFNSEYDPCEDIFSQYITQGADDDLAGNANNADEEDIIFVYMDIQSPIQTLKILLQQKVQRDLEKFDVWLQNVQMLEPHKTLVDQCVKGEGLVQVNAQILYSTNRINIADVVKPTEEVLNASKTDQPPGLDANIGQLSDTPKSNELASTLQTNTNNGSKSAAGKTANETKQEFVNWVVDREFLVQKRKLGIPDNPAKWTNAHIKIWLEWAINQFSLELNENDWKFGGKELCDLTLEQFQRMVPSDPGNKFWTHLELLRKCQFIAIPGDPHSIHNPHDDEDMDEDDDDDDDADDGRDPDNGISDKKNPRALGTRPKNIGMDTLSSLTNQGNRSGNNGQIQLWQFLLEILTDRERLNIIQWIDGGDGEFKLIDPEDVAKLWGERKNKPTMNYEKLSRALRYYYDGDMISKVGGKRFVYKFVCDLKQLTGYSAQQLSDRVNGRSRERKFNTNTLNNFNRIS